MAAARRVAIGIAFAVLGGVLVVCGLVLAAYVAAVWRPCFGDRLPFDDTVSLDCAAVVSGRPTEHLRELWPVALVAVVIALARGLVRRPSVPVLGALVALVFLAVLAHPLIEFFLLVHLTGAWDEPPGNGMFTAITLMLAGAVLIASRAPRTPADERVGP